MKLKSYPERRHTMALLLFAALCWPSLAPASVHALFDLASPAAGPFPSDQFTVADATQLTGRRVNLPRPDCTAQPNDCEDIDNINTLDGFNVQPQLTVTFDGPIDVTTVSSNNLLLVQLDPSSPLPVGINQIVWDIGTLGLYVEADELLNQTTGYALIVTRGILDAAGSPVEASADFTNFVNSGMGPYHTSLLQGLAAAQTLGINQADIVTASVFTTLSVTAVLERIRDQIKEATPDPASFIINGARQVYAAEEVSSMVVRRQTRVCPPAFTSQTIDLTLLHVPGAVGTIAFGTFTSPDYELPERAFPAIGTATGTPVVQGTNTLYFDLILPIGPKPDNGWPVAIYGHGGSGTKETVVNFAWKMASHGIATIGINSVGFGFGSLGTIELGLPSGPMTIPSGGRGVDLDGDNTIDANEGFDASAPYTIVTNRDGVRQYAADLLQLVRVIQVGMDVDGNGVSDLDPNRIYFFGTSRGGTDGYAFVAVESAVRAGVFISSGGSRPESRRMSPNTRNREGLLLQNRTPSLINYPGLTEIGGYPVQPPYFNENKPLRNVAPVINEAPGAINIQHFLENEEWVNQPADAVAYASHLQTNPLPGLTAKPVIIQFGKGDMSLPNPMESAVVRAGSFASFTSFYRNDLAYADNPLVPKDPHTAILSINLPALRDIARGMQEQVATFFDSDGVEMIHPTPAQYFEVPIELPLPEDLSFIP